MRNKSVWEHACGLTRTVVEGVAFDEGGDAIVVSVRPAAKARGRCGRCRRRCPRYDLGEGRRRWRALDLGTTKVFVEANAPRVRCRAHGVTVAAVPWARHGARHTRDFDDLAAWLAVRTSKSAVMELLRVAWRTVGAIVTRVNADIDQTVDRLDGLRRIGIDEISYKRGHRYLIVVVDHDTGRLVWAGPGRNDTALEEFFDTLGAERAALLTHVSADMADWIARVVADRAPNAVRSADPFHIVGVGDRSARYRTPPRMERRQGPPSRPRVPSPSPLDRRRQTHRPRPLRVMEEPRRAHRSSTPPARLDRQDRPAAVARLSPQRRTPLRVRGQRRSRQTSHSTAGSNGRADRVSPRSCNSNAVSAPTAKRSTSRSTPASRKASSNRPTRKSDYSPASRSGSTDPNHSSRSPCSPSAHTHPASPADNDPRKQQESPITADRHTPEGNLSRREARSNAEHIGSSAFAAVTDGPIQVVFVALTIGRQADL